MRDPFAPNSNSSVLRDAQVGLLLVAVLLGVFVYVAYYRVTGQGRTLPDHVRMAPVATAVWPNGPPTDPAMGQLGETSPTTIAASNKLSSNRSAPAQPTANKVARIDRATTAKTNKPNLVRTDRHVSPVDFQQAEPSKGSPPAVEGISTRDIAISRMGLNPGDRIDSSKIRKTGRGNLNNIFDHQGRPQKIIVRPPEMGKPTAPEFSTVPRERPKQLDATNQRATDNPKAAAKASRPSNFSPQPFAAKSSHSNFEQRSQTKAAPRESINLVPVSPPVRSLPSSPPPAITTPAPSLRPSKPVPKKETGNSFKPTLKAFRPHSSPPGVKRTDFIPQKDIAHDAVAAAVATSEPTRLPAPEITKSIPTPLPDARGPASAPSNSSSNSYIAKEGDSFWSIALTSYGDGRFFHALYEWNRDTVSDFDHLPAMTKLEVPNRKTLQSRWPDLCPQDESTESGISQQTIAEYDSHLSERLYITQKGDTLFDIAAKTLGQASRYVEILAKNDQRLPSEINHLAPLESGLRLVLPD